MHHVEPHDRAHASRPGTGDRDDHAVRDRRVFDDAARWTEHGDGRRCGRAASRHDHDERYAEGTISRQSVDQAASAGGRSSIRTLARSASASGPLDSPAADCSTEESRRDLNRVRDGGEARAETHEIRSFVQHCQAIPVMPTGQSGLQRPQSFARPSPSSRRFAGFSRRPMTILDLDEQGRSSHRATFGAIIGRLRGNLTYDS